MKALWKGSIFQFKAQLIAWNLVYKKWIKKDKAMLCQGLQWGVRSKPFQTVENSTPETFLSEDLGKVPIPGQWKVFLSKKSPEEFPWAGSSRLSGGSGQIFARAFFSVSNSRCVYPE